MPTYRMPDERMRGHAAAWAELENALGTARCSAQLAGLEAEEFVVRELLLTVIRAIDRAADSVRRLYASS
jgi:hypothetical protein